MKLWQNIPYADGAENPKSKSRARSVQSRCSEMKTLFSAKSKSNENAVIQSTFQCAIMDAVVCHCVRRLGHELDADWFGIVVDVVVTSNGGHLHERGHKRRVNSNARSANNGSLGMKLVDGFIHDLNSNKLFHEPTNYIRTNEPTKKYQVDATDSLKGGFECTREAECRARIFPYRRWRRRTFVCAQQ